MAAHSSILAQRTLWTAEPGGLCPWVCTESDTTQEAQHACRHVLERIQISESFSILCTSLISAAHSCHVALGSSPPSLVLLRLLGWEKGTFFRVMTVICLSDSLPPALPQSPINVLLPCCLASSFFIFASSMQTPPSPPFLKAAPPHSWYCHSILMKILGDNKRIRVQMKKLTEGLTSLPLKNSVSPYSRESIGALCSFPAHKCLRLLGSAVSHLPFSSLSWCP